MILHPFRRTTLVMDHHIGDDFDSNRDDDDDDDSRKYGHMAQVTLYHGLLMIVAWMILLPLAVACSALLRKHDRPPYYLFFRPHYIGAIVATMVSILGFVLAVRNFTTLQEGWDESPIRFAHAVLGTVAMYGIIFNMIIYGGLMSLPPPPPPPIAGVGHYHTTPIGASTPRVDTFDPDHRRHNGPTRSLVVVDPYRKQRYGHWLHKVFGYMVLFCGWGACFTGMHITYLYDILFQRILSITALGTALSIVVFLYFDRYHNRNTRYHRQLDDDGGIHNFAISNTENGNNNHSNNGINHIRSTSVNPHPTDPTDTETTPLLMN